MSEAPFMPVQFMRDGLDPVPELARAREQEPVSKLEFPGGGTAWLVTRYDDVRAVLSDTDRFSNDFGNVSAASDQEGETDPGGLGFRDPPEHTRLRKLLTPEFTVRRLRRLTPRIEAIVAEHLDALEAAGPPADLVPAFAFPIPSLVVCELLGVPYTERADFMRRSGDRFDFTASPEAAIAATNESVAYLQDLVVRERKNPGDGLLGMLIREHGDDVDDRVLAGLADGMLTGGHDTTASMLALGTLVLLRDPDLAALVRSGDERVNDVVEELLRYLSVVQVPFPRLTREEVELGGQRIGAGELVLCSLSSANRDSALGADMDRVNPDRADPAPHLAFGYGAHHCVGAQLARMEMRIAYPALLRRFPELRLAVPDEQVAFREFSVVYGVTGLPVTW